MSHTRGYSEFFASGIRVVSRRFATPRFDSIKSLPLAFDSASDSDSTKSTAKRRARPTSMIITLPTSAIASHPKPQQRQRRSSLISFSSRLFGRKPRSILSTEESGWVSSATDSTSSLHDQLEFWDMGGSPRPSCPNGGIEHPLPLDPFSSSPSSKSFFVDLQDAPKTGSSTPSSKSTSPSPSSFFSRKRDSFLHITSTPPPDASFLHLPHIRRSKGRDQDSHTCERPVSIHNIPTSLSTTTNNNTATTSPPPPPSATSSARSSHIRRPWSRESSSFLSKSSSISVAIPEDHDTNFNITSSSQPPPIEPIINVIEEEEAPVSATDAHIFFSRDDDVPARMDWRQFHIDLLAGHDA